MNIYITLDYEIYFGENHGTVEKCVIYPTSELIRIANKHNVHFSFFVDCGFILKLDEYRKKYPQLENDYKKIIEQVKFLAASGHDIQLHIHPHWEDSYYNGEKWTIDIKRYKLTDFKETEISDIVYRYKKVIAEITGKTIFAFRAGGWCLQPFTKIKKAFIENQITLDSSVFRNGHYTSEHYSYDFRTAPDKDIYHFDDEPTIENPSGYFTEVPISGIRNSPLFFWRLFFLGRKKPKLHKPIGDGRAMPAPGYRKNLLTKITNNPASIDGYNAHLLGRVLKTLLKKKREHMVVIGHPKALSPYSIKKLEEFIEKNKEHHNFTTYSNQFLNKQ